MTEVDDLFSRLEDTDDIGQRRYLMYRIFDRLLEKSYNQWDGDFPQNERVKQLREFDGYMYKLAQEFLTSSSTMEKEEKLEAIRDHIL